MTTPRRRIVRPRAVIPAEDVEQERQRRELRERLERERLALGRWLRRLRRSFHAFEKLHLVISRLERQIARLEDERMAETPAKRPIDIVTACMNKNGSPAFALTTVAVTPEQIEDGVHYYLAEADLLEAGYEEPFVHFDAQEAPPFLHPAVREYLGSSPSPVTTTPTLLEKQ